jgi:hypothetical protein
MRFHAEPLVAGLVFLVVGVAFVLEALGIWTLGVDDLRFAGPLALVVAGLGVLAVSVARSQRVDRGR